MSLSWQHLVVGVWLGCNLSCASETDDLSGFDVDGRVTDGFIDQFCELTPDSGIFVGAGLVSGRRPFGCNECACSFGKTTCNDGGCEILCTAAGCDVDGAVRVESCTSSAQCGSMQFSNYDTCVYNAGCNEPFGYCVHVQNSCATFDAVPSDGTAEIEYCGCDGVTYEGPCPLVPYRHSGPCRD